MPVSMVFEYQYVILFLKEVHENRITPNINKNEKTNATFLLQRANNYIGDWWLLTKGVNLFNSYLMGEEGGRPSGLRIRLAGALWEGGV